MLQDQYAKKVVDQNGLPKRMQAGDATRYKLRVARDEYLAAVRPDIQFASQKLCINMARSATNIGNNLLVFRGI